ncbi:hypothetical protein Tco_0597889 [Tanacetum coccineum]
MMLSYHGPWDKVSVTMTLIYQGRHKGLERSCTSSKSVAPVRNRILVYPDSDEEDEEYCSLPPLLLCFQTPQPCATLNPVHHNNHSEVDIESMTLEEYARYELAMSTMKNEIQDSSFDEILDDLFRIGAENIRKLKHEVPNRCDDIYDYEDCDQENGELLDLPTLYATNEIASDSEQVKENTDIAEEKEEVPMKDVEMDENHDIDHSGTEEALQWSLAKDPFLVVMELNDQSSFLLHTIPSFVSNEDLEEVQVEDVEMDEDEDIDHSNTKEEIQWSHAHDPFLVVLEPDVQSSFLLRTIPSSISNEQGVNFMSVTPGYSTAPSPSASQVWFVWCLILPILAIQD